MQKKSFPDQNIIELSSEKSQKILSKNLQIWNLLRFKGEALRKINLWVE